MVITTQQAAVANKMNQLMEMIQLKTSEVNVHLKFEGENVTIEVTETPGQAHYEGAVEDARVRDISSKTETFKGLLGMEPQSVETSLTTNELLRKLEGAISMESLKAQRMRN